MSGEKANNSTILYLLALSIILIIPPAISHAIETEPVFNPKLDIHKTNGSIKIDGKIEDGEWADAGKADNFVERQPGVNLPPAVKTEAYITYDDANLYVAFNCYDNPAEIRATMCQRDQYSSGMDDVVTLLLDTYGNSTWAYELMVNPYGVQKDLLWSSIHGDDSGFDLIWESAASINETGYQVEMAIPFTSMRFPNRDVQVWKVDFYRNQSRESFKQFSWAAYDKDEQCWPCQWGTVTGIRDVKPGKGLEIMPTIIGTQAGYISDYNDPDSKFINDDADAELSVGAKYSISSDITLEGAYNPDFSQIEADAAQIDVNSTISLFYPERRPFFQEGRDIFQTLFNSFYTRTINDPQYAIKMTGRLNKFNIGFLSAYDENTPYMIPLVERSILVNTGESYVNILRATKSIGEDNHIGIILNDRRFDGGGYNSILAFDHDFRLSQKYSIVGQYIMSFTEEQDDSALSASFNGETFDDGKHTVAFDGETFSGAGHIFQIRRRARNWNFTIDYNHVAPAYRTETGYDPWNDYHNLSIWNDWNFYPEDGIVQQISPEIWLMRKWSYGGVIRWNQADISCNTNFRWAQSYFGVSLFTGTERWGGINFKDLWNINFWVGSQFSNAIGYDMDFTYGTSVARWLLEKGNELSLNLSFDLKPIDRLTIEPEINYARSESKETNEELYKQTITRTRFRLQATKELSTRLVVQYDDSNDNLEIDPLITYRISPFSMFYIGSTHDITELTDAVDDHKKWKETERQFFMKLQYLFRI